MEILERKANPITQHLDHYMIEQFKDSTKTDKQANKASKLSSEEKDQEVARLRKELALLKVQKGEDLGQTKQVMQVEVSGRQRSTVEPPKAKRTEREVAVVDRLERRRSGGQTDADSDSYTTVITVDEGKRRRSSANTSSGSSSTSFTERRREPRFYSRRPSKDLERRDFYVVQATEPLPRSSNGSKEVARFREVTVHQRQPLVLPGTDHRNLT